MMLFGFFSGLPIGLTGVMLQAWMTKGRREPPYDRHLFPRRCALYAQVSLVTLYGPICPALARQETRVDRHSSACVAHRDSRVGIKFTSACPCDVRSPRALCRLRLRVPGHCNRRLQGRPPQRTRTGRRGSGLDDGMAHRSLGLRRSRPYPCRPSRLAEYLPPHVRSHGDRHSGGAICARAGHESRGPEEHG